MPLQALLLFMACSPSYSSSIDDDFVYLQSIIPGHYDNSWQIFGEMVNVLEPALRHQRLSLDFFAEDIPIFPSSVATFRLQEYNERDPKNIFRHKIYAFQINFTTQEIISKFYNFVDPARFVNSQDNPGLCQNLTWSDLIYLPGCDVKWDRVEPFLFRTSVIDRCVIVYNNVSFEVVDSNYLTQTYLTINEKWTYVSNGSVFLSGMPYNLTKQLGTRKKTTHHIENNQWSSRRRLGSFEEITTALSRALPVILYIDVIGCKEGNSFHNSNGTFDSEGDFSIEGFSISIETFEFFNSSVFGPLPFLGFSHAPVVRTANGEMIELREAKVVAVGGLILTVTWLKPADYTIEKRLIFGCLLQDDSLMTSGQVMAVTPDLNLTRVTNFRQLIAAIKRGYNFRFNVRYYDCQQGPDVNAFAGGNIEGMNIDLNARSVSFAKSTLITNYQGSGYVIDFGSGVIHERGFYVTFTVSDNYRQGFNRAYIETFVCDMTTDFRHGAVDLYMY